MGGIATRWRRHWPIAALLAVAALSYAPTAGAGGMLMWDEAEYATLGRSLWRGEGYAIDGTPHALRPPLLPLAEAVSFWLAGHADDRAVHATTLPMALTALLILYAVSATVYDRATAVVAVVLLGSAPWFFTATGSALSELPLLACFGAAVWCWSAGLLCDARWFYASWLCIGVAFLTRYTALLVGPLAALLTVLELARGDAAVRRRVGSRAFVLAPLVGLAVVAPWLARQALVFGDPLVGMRAASTQLQIYLPEVAMPWWQYAADLPAMLSGGTVLLLLVGGAAALWRRDRFAIHCLVTVLAVLGWFSAYRYKEPRLVSALLPAAALLAALALTRRPLGPAPRGVLAVIVGGLALLNAGAARRDLERVRVLGYPSFLEAMAFVRQHSAADALLVGPNEPQIAWYADRPVEPFPARAALAPGLARAAWVVITNFERGQPPYVEALAARLPEQAFADGAAVRFRGAPFTTLLVRPERLLAVAAATPPS